MPLIINTCRSRLTLAPLLAALALLSVNSARVAAASQESPRTDPALLEEAWGIVSEHFYDPQFNGVDWPAMLEVHRAHAQRAASMQELAAVVNQMLATLGASHTAFYTSADREYYELLDIFRGAGEFGEQVRERFPHGVRYEGIGIDTRLIDGRVFVADILEGLPAHDAGVQVGDEILAVGGEPFAPVRSFQGKAGKPVRLLVQPTADPISRETVMIEPVWIVPHEAFEQAMRRSARIVEHEGLQIAHVRVRSYASPRYQEILVELLTQSELASADALVLDLRGGWGGANPSYVDLFNRNVPTLTMIARDGEEHTLDGRWRKPVVLLVDETVRSGKEIIAHAFKTRGIGPVVGTRTAGAVVGGRPFLLSDGSLLYVAALDARIDGQRLEGRGVEPDVQVDFTLPYSEGDDPQLRRAVEEAARLR